MFKHAKNVKDSIKEKILNTNWFKIKISTSGVMPWPSPANSRDLRQNACIYYTNKANFMHSLSDN